MVGSDSTVRDGLIVHLEVFLKFFGSKGVVVGTKVLESDTIKGGKTFEATFAFDSFSSSKGHLAFDVDVTGIMVVEDGATMVLVGSSFFSFSIRKSTSCARYPLIQ
jgi:hypothetical protein